jgi:hypothetical protein
MRLFGFCFSFCLATVVGAVDTVGARAESECVPACRDGFMCHEGRCISACNPPCGAGETCTAAGQCVAQRGGTTTGATSTTPGGIPIVEQDSSSVVVVEASTSTPAPYATGGWTTPPQGAQPLPEEPPSEDPSFSIGGNVGGFFFFGPVLAFEFGSHLAGNVRLRFPQAGLANQLLDFGTFSDWDTTLGFSFAVGAGIRYYLTSDSTLRGLYVGAAAELERRQWTRENWLTDDMETGDGIRATAVADIGYRIGWTGFFLGFGGQLGFASRDDLQDSGFFGTIVIELGFYL